MKVKVNPVKLQPWRTPTTSASFLWKWKWHCDNSWKWKWNRDNSWKWKWIQWWCSHATHQQHQHHFCESERATVKLHESESEFMSEGAAMAHTNDVSIISVKVQQWNFMKWKCYGALVRPWLFRGVKDCFHTVNRICIWWELTKNLMGICQKSISAFLIADQLIINIGFKIPVRPVTGKVAEASLLSHGHIQLPSTRAARAERMEDIEWYIICMDE